jgi:hypothetical protein
LPRWPEADRGRTRLRFGVVLDRLEAKVADVRQALTAAFLAWLAVLSGLAGSGCGSPAYRMKDHPTAPAARPDVKAEAGGIEIRVDALLIYEGPGAWKRQAYWDEYGVTFTNRGLAAATIDGVTLGDVLDREVAPGDDPWVLDKAGRKHEQFLKRLGAPADAPLSAMSRSKQLLTGTAAVGGLALIYGGVGAATVGPALVFAGPFLLLVAAPVVAANHFLVDPGNKELVRAEFNRRRLPLPCEIPPGGAVSGSLFFPLTPGPEHLDAIFRTAGGSSGLRVELPGLEGLHFTYIPDKAALKAAKPERFFIKRVPEKQPAPAR